MCIPGILSGYFCPLRFSLHTSSHAASAAQTINEKNACTWHSSVCNLDFLSWRIGAAYKIFTHLPLCHLQQYKQLLKKCCSCILLILYTAQQKTLLYSCASRTLKITLRASHAPAYSALSAPNSHSSPTQLLGKIFLPFPYWS